MRRGGSVMERSGDAEERASYHNPLAVRVYPDLAYYIQRVGFLAGVRSRNWLADGKSGFA